MDTSFYGSLLLEKDRKQVIDKIKATKSIYVIGLDIIEDELCDTPTHVTYRGEATRQLLLTIYDFLVDEKIKLPSIAAYLAEQYFAEYWKRAKKQKQVAEKNLKVDFEIIAIASIKSVDVVVSADTRTMLSDSARKAYDIVNARNSLRTPELIDYDVFMRGYFSENGNRGGASA